MSSGVVRFLKLALPLAALALIVAVFVAPRDDLSLDFADFDFDFRDGLRLEQPRFSGADAAGRPFRVTAEWALPDAPDPERIELGPVDGEMLADDDRRIRLRADGGVIEPKARRLTLAGEVTVETEDGWTLSAPSARADLRDETVVAEGPVTGSGPSGALEAGAMRAAREDGRDYIRFDGGVRLRIDPGAELEREPR